MTDEQKEFEELVSVVDKVLRYGVKCPSSKYCEFCGGKLSMPCVVCKIATELQNVNNRKGEVISYQAAFDAQAASRITQLEQELAIAQGTKNRLTIFDRIEIHDRAAKETAKRIFEELKANEEPNPEYCDCWLVAVEGKKFIEIAKKYGVEVT